MSEKNVDKFWQRVREIPPEHAAWMSLREMIEWAERPDDKPERQRTGDEPV